MLTETLTDAQEQKVHEPDEQWSDSFAFNVTKRDFETAENFRTQNHDARWTLSENLYYGAEKQRYWEGTKMKRSSLSSFVVFSDICSILPRWISTVFADSPNWFEVGPDFGTTMMQASMVRDLMLYQMNKMKHLRNESVREVLRCAALDGLLFGIGPVEMCWLDTKLKLRKMNRQQVNPLRIEQHPLLGPVPRAGGAPMTQYFQQEDELSWGQPYLKHVSAKDVYIDPNHTKSTWQTARYACKRTYLTVDELWAKRDEEGFKIPDRKYLVQLANDKPSGQNDRLKANAEQSRGGTWNPSTDTTIDPGGKNLEVITRWSKDRCTWMVNREELVYNVTNSYGFQPLFNLFYVDAPGRPYGMSIADVVEGEHRLQAATINARVDEMALHIHGRMVKKRGRSIPQSQLRRRPGQIIEADNPKEDVVIDNMSPALEQAFLEVQASEARNQKIIGMSDIVASGTPPSGGNSANRSATGITVQAQAAGSRMGYHVENIEDTVLEPILYAWHFLNTQFLPPDQLLHILKQDGQEASIDPLQILNADVVFAMRASSKMQSRQALMQAFPLVAQTFLNPELMSLMHQTGKTFDIEEFATMILDMTGYKARGKFVRPLTPQEQQMLQQQAQQAQDNEMQKQRERMADMKELQDMKNQGAIAQTVLDKGLEATLIEPQKQAKKNAE